MDTNKMREQFDVYWRRQLWAECYEDVKEQMFMVWNASREAVVVELPEPETLDVDCDESLEMEPEEYEVLEASHGARWSEHSRLKKAIEAQGLKVAP